MAQVQVKTTLKRKLKQSAPTTSTTATAQHANISQTLEFAQQQSFKVVHTVLHSSLAYLAYLRHLFPEDCFIDRSFESIYTDAEAKIRLRARAQGIRKKQKKNRERSSPADMQPNLKVFVQDSHPGVKTFLGWLVATRFLTCYIFHSSDPPCDFKPHGFGASVDKAMNMPCNRDWRPNTIEAGFVDSGHHRSQEIHACYSCLFKDVDPKLLAELKDFALTRQCLWLFYAQDPPKSQAELIRALGK
ncbi:MAG: hypothetical protein L6R41_003072 [Letrouitia leprolyta]|nr:MAG: hypothetical protein L6R41_003072 [Letrouitia leprolyta]